MFARFHEFMAFGKSQASDLGIKFAHMPFFMVKPKLELNKCLAGGYIFMKVSHPLTHPLPVTRVLGVLWGNMSAEY